MNTSILPTRALALHLIRQEAHRHSHPHSTMEDSSQYILQFHTRDFPDYPSSESEEAREWEKKKQCSKQYGFQSSNEKPFL